MNELNSITQWKAGPMPTAPMDQIHLFTRKIKCKMERKFTTITSNIYRNFTLHGIARENALVYTLLKINGQVRAVVICINSDLTYLNVRIASGEVFKKYQVFSNFFYEWQLLNYFNIDEKKIDDNIMCVVNVYLFTSS